jgi:hypothetical protein
MSLLLNLNLKHLSTCLKIKKVFYSFDSFHVVMHQILRMLISVDYILNIIKSKIPSLRHRCPSWVLKLSLNPVGCHPFNDFYIILASNLLIMSVPHEGYSKNASCSISILLFPYYLLTCDYLFYLKQFIQQVFCNLELLNEMYLCSCL